jgi:hypothetical protein
LSEKAARHNTAAASNRDRAISQGGSTACSDDAMIAARFSAMAQVPATLIKDWGSSTIPQRSMVLSAVLRGKLNPIPARRSHYDEENKNDFMQKNLP